MPKIQHQMGTPGWADEIFAQPPFRRLRGPSKHTQYHETYIEVMKKTMGAQGRTEAIALIALEYLTMRGVISRFKEQPFRTLVPEFGCAIVPDFLAQDAKSEELFVLEMKTSRYVTRMVASQLEQNRKKFLEYGMKYVLWTDQQVLTTNTRHNLLNMRRFGKYVPPKVYQPLAERVHKEVVITIADVYKFGFDWSSVFAAAWWGIVFLPLSEYITGETQITTYTPTSLRSTFSLVPSDDSEWWQNLPTC